MLWIKAFHIIGVVCWFSGIFYLPRLFVYHAMSEDQLSQGPLRYHGEEAILVHHDAIGGVWPSFLGAWLLIANHGYFMAWWWMKAKLGLVVLANRLSLLLLVVYEGAAGKTPRSAATNTSESTTSYRCCTARWRS